MADVCWYCIISPVVPLRAGSLVVTDLSFVFSVRVVGFRWFIFPVKVVVFQRVWWWFGADPEVLGGLGVVVVSFLLE